MIDATDMEDAGPGVPVRAHQRRAPSKAPVTGITDPFSDDALHQRYNALLDQGVKESAAAAQVETEKRAALYNKLLDMKIPESEAATHVMRAFPTSPTPVVGDEPKEAQFGMGLGRTLADQALWGQGAKVKGVIGAVKASLTGNPTDEELGGIYRDARDTEREGLAAYQKANPITATIGRAAVGIPLLFASGGSSAAPEAATSLGGRVLQGVIRGAKATAPFTALQATGAVDDPGDMLAAGVRGALGGAAVGGAIGGAIPLGQAVLANANKVPVIRSAFRAVTGRMPLMGDVAQMMGSVAEKAPDVTAELSPAAKSVHAYMVKQMGASPEAARAAIDQALEANPDVGHDLLSAAGRALAGKPPVIRPQPVVQPLAQPAVAAEPALPGEAAVPAESPNFLQALKNAGQATKVRAAQMPVIRPMEPAEPPVMPTATETAQRLRGTLGIQAVKAPTEGPTGLTVNRPPSVADVVGPGAVPAGAKPLTFADALEQTPTSPEIPESFQASTAAAKADALTKEGYAADHLRRAIAGNPGKGQGFLDLPPEHQAAMGGVEGFAANYKGLDEAGQTHIRNRLYQLNGDVWKRGELNAQQFPPVDLFQEMEQAKAVLAQRKLPVTNANIRAVLKESRPDAVPTSAPVVPPAAPDPIEPPDDGPPTRVIAPRKSPTALLRARVEKLSDLDNKAVVKRTSDLFGRLAANREKIDAAVKSGDMIIDAPGVYKAGVPDEELDPSFGDEAAQLQGRTFTYEPRATNGTHKQWLEQMDRDQTELEAHQNELAKRGFQPHQLAAIRARGESARLKDPILPDAEDPSATADIWNPERGRSRIGALVGAGAAAGAGLTLADYLEQSFRPARKKP